MNNESQFFRDLARLETVEYSPPLTRAEIRQIYWDVADGKHTDPLLELARRIEHAHGIGVKKCKTI
jgi:hypothetical protein